MKTPSTRTRRIATAAATPVAIIAAAALVWQSSYAAFTGTTRNSGNDWATGSVALTDDDAGSARFQVTNMLPDDTETKCITVTANTTGNPLVNRQSLSTLALANNWANAVGGWAVTAGTQSRTYQFTWVFDTTGLTQSEIDQFQGTHTGIDVQWELQSS